MYIFKNKKKRGYKYGVYPIENMEGVLPIGHTPVITWKGYSPEHPNQTQHIYTDLTKLHTTESDLDGITSFFEFIEVNLMIE